MDHDGVEWSHPDDERLTKEKIADLEAERDRTAVRIAQLFADLCKAEAETARLDALNRELAVDLKEWRIRFPVNDPTIARRMVEDRARAEAESALATERAARESAEAERDEARARARTEGIERAEAVAARIEAEKLAVWAMRNGLGVYSFTRGTRVYYFDVRIEGNGRRAFEFDGTDAGILAALRRSMEGEK